MTDPQRIIEDVRRLQQIAVDRLLSIEVGDIVIAPNFTHFSEWSSGEHLLVLEVYPLDSGYGSARTQFKRRVQLLAHNGPMEKDLWEHYFHYDVEPDPREFHVKILKRAN